MARKTEGKQMLLLSYNCRRRFTILFSHNCCRQSFQPKSGKAATAAVVGKKEHLFVLALMSICSISTTESMAAMRIR